MAVHGKDVLIEFYSEAVDDYVPALCLENFSISFEPELINITTVGLLRGYDYKERRRGWGVSMSGITAEGRTVFTNLLYSGINARYQIRATFTELSGDFATFTGTIMLEGATINSGAVGDFSDWEQAFKGCGPYTLLINGQGGVMFRILQENGDALLQENNDHLILENG
jgi:hypothetical protein